MSEGTEGGSIKFLFPACSNYISPPIMEQVKSVVALRLNKPTIHQIIAWTAWAAFLLFSVGACIFAIAEKHDVYFITHYQHFPMDKLTVVMTTYPAWMMIVPFLWLPFVIAYQSQNNPAVGPLLLQTATRFIVGLVVAVLLLCSGPPFQM